MRGPVFPSDKCQKGAPVRQKQDVVTPSNAGFGPNRWFLVLESGD